MGCPALPDRTCQVCLHGRLVVQRSDLPALTLDDQDIPYLRPLRHGRKRQTQSIQPLIGLDQTVLGEVQCQRLIHDHPTLQGQAVPPLARAAAPHPAGLIVMTVINKGHAGVTIGEFGAGRRPDRLCRRFVDNQLVNGQRLALHPGRDEIQRVDARPDINAEHGQQGRQALAGTGHPPQGKAGHKLKHAVGANRIQTGLVADIGDDVARRHGPNPTVQPMPALPVLAI